jgi:replicative DNA helicase
MEAKKDKLDDLKKVPPDLGAFFKLIDQPDRIFTVDQLSGDPPEVEWVVEKFLPRDVVGMVAATGSTGKTFFLLQMALCVASGKPFLGKETGDPADVLIIAAEETKADIHRRVDAIRKYYGIDPEAGKRLTVASVNGISGIKNRIHTWEDNVEPSQLFDALILYVKATKPRLVILDPTRRFLSGDENNSENADQFINDVEAIKNEGRGETTLLLAHHTSKGGAGGRDQHASRGSSAFVDGARWQLVMAGLDPLKEWEYDDGNILSVDDIRQHLRIELTKYNSFVPDQHEFILERRSGGVLDTPTSGISEVGTQRNGNQKGESWDKPNYQKRKN